MAKTPRKADGKPAKRDKPHQAELPTKGNRQLTAQNRKFLGKHYAVKYGKRKGGQLP